MNREFKLSNLLRRNKPESNRDLIEEARWYLKANQPPDPRTQATRSLTFPSYPASAPEEPAKPGLPESKEPPKPQNDSGPTPGSAPIIAECREIGWLNKPLGSETLPPKARPSYNTRNIRHYIQEQQEPSFNMLVMRHIDSRGEKDSDVYRRAFIDRRIFSKIRSDAGYHPSKETAIALALSLQLGKQQAAELLGAAGYTLSKSATFDLIIAFCLEEEIYDLCDVNDILEYFGEHLLGE